MSRKFTRQVSPCRTITKRHSKTYAPVFGSGYLVFDDGSSPMVGYKLVLDRDSFCGGGFLIGLSEEDSLKAERYKMLRLSLGSDKYLELAVGHYDGPSLPIVVLGLTTASDRS